MRQKIEGEFPAAVRGGAKFDRRTARGMLCRHIYCDLLGRKPHGDGSDCRDQIRISTDQYEVIADILIGIVEHIHRDIHVRPLLLWCLKKSAAQIGTGW